MLSIDEEVTMVEGLACLVGVALSWLVWRGSDRAELPGEATEPDPTRSEESRPARGRTLE